MRLPRPTASRLRTGPVVSARSRTQRRYRGWLELYQDPATVGVGRMARQTAHFKSHAVSPISITGGRRHIVPARIGSTGLGIDKAAKGIGEHERKWSAVGRRTQRISDSAWYVGACQSIH